MISAARRSRLGSTLAVAIASAVTAIAFGVGAPAHAATATSCPGTAEHPFAKWLDPATYVLAPDGNFESATTGWQLAGGAKLLTGNEPFKVNPSANAHSLSIPAGGSATSAAFCVGLAHPDLRFFAVGGNLTSMLKVEIIYKTALGTITQPVTVVPGMSAWRPTVQALILANATGLLSLEGLTSSVQLRFTAQGKAGWNIDDVYIDPWKTT